MFGVNFIGVSIEQFQDKLTFLESLFFILFAITCINIFLAIYLSTNQVNIQIQNTRLKSENIKLKSTNSFLAVTIKQNFEQVKIINENVETLIAQMAQVHDWLGRLTISDFMQCEITTTEIMEELTERVNWINQKTEEGEFKTDEKP